MSLLHWYIAGTSTPAFIDLSIVMRKPSSGLPFWITHGETEGSLALTLFPLVELAVSGG
jgi:hypothetical protein